MRFNRQIRIHDKFNFIGSINYSQSIYLAQDKQKHQNYLIKRIQYQHEIFLNIKSQQQSNLKKLYNNNQNSVLKPQYHSFSNDCLYLCNKIHKISLFNLLQIYKYYQTQFDRISIWTMLVQLYNLLNRMKRQNIYHHNMKPTNIFYNVDQKGQITWMLSECLFNTINPNPLYFKKVNIDMSKSRNNSRFMDPQHIDFYALGVIVLEMITLTDPQEISKILQNESPIEDIPNYRQARNYYGDTTIDFIRLLINPRENINQVFRNYKDSKPEFQMKSNSFDIKQYFLDQNKLNDFIKKGLITQVDSNLKSFLRQKNIKSKQILQILQKYDKQLQFKFDNIKDFQSLLIQCEIKLQQQQLFLLAFYYTKYSSIYYMNLIMKSITAHQMLQTIIKDALQKEYQSAQVFYKIVASKKTGTWTIQCIYQFFKNLNIELNKQIINQTLKIWTSENHRKYISKSQFLKVFGNYINQSKIINKSRAVHQNLQNVQSNQDNAIAILNNLKKNLPNNNIVAFFRLHDNKSMWVVNSQIDKEIKQYANLPDGNLKSGLKLIWDKGQIKGQNNVKQLRYIYILKLFNILTEVQLIRAVLVELMNQSSRQTIYQKYLRDERGWNLNSLIDLNSNQYLQFSDRQLKMVFNQLDSDGSGYVNKRELMFKLTGVVQFDQQVLIESIKNQITLKNVDLFDLMLQKDQNRDLFLDEAVQIQQCFKLIGLQVPLQHCVILFDKFKRVDKFQYMVFLRFFYSNLKIFIKACIFLIHSMYHDDFDRFYKLGIKGDQRKWNSQSFNRVNSQLLLGFSQNEIGKIWQQFDANHDVALTREEIANGFGLKVEKYDGLERKQLESIEDLTQKINDNQKPRDINTNNYNQVQQQNDQLVKLLKNHNIQNLAQQFYQLSFNNGLIQESKLISCLQKQNIFLSKEKMQEALKNYKTKERKGSTCINYVKLLMFLITIKEEGENKNKIFRVQSPSRDKQKAKIIAKLFALHCAAKNLSNEEVFLRCKEKGKMNLIDFEESIKWVIGCQIYFEDIEDAWRYWGEPEYLSYDDYLRTLASSKFKDLPAKIPSRTPPRPQKSSYRGWDQKRQQSPTVNLINEKKQSRSLFTQSVKNAKSKLTVPKEYLINQLLRMVDIRGSEQLNSLYADQNVIQKTKLMECLVNSYDFQKNDAIELTNSIAQMGKIKLSTLRNIMPKVKASKLTKNSRLKMDDTKILKKLLDPRRQKINIPLIKQHIKLIIAAFNKNQYSKSIQNYYFQGRQSIKFEQYLQKSRKIAPTISQEMQQKIYKYITNNNDSMTIIQFKISFTTQQQIAIQYYLPQQLQKQLQQIFNQSDKNKNGSIELQQIQYLMKTLGINQTQKQLYNYFKQIDLNFDGKINYQQFRNFCENVIFPFIINWIQDSIVLLKLLNINDLFNIGYVPIRVFAVIIEKFGVKLNQQDILTLSKHVADNNQISINHLMQALQFPNNPSISSNVKRVLYKIKWKKKVFIKDIQKIFKNISSTFINSYTSQAIRKNIVSPASPFEPHLHDSMLYYKDYYYKDYRKVIKNSPQPVLSDQLRPNDLLFELRLQEACGVPIPQDSKIKNNILRRFVNITFFDMSLQTVKHSICSVQAEWEIDCQDRWLFNNENRSIFIRYCNYNQKSEKILVLLELVIALNDGNRLLQISCGSASFLLKETYGMTSRLNKALRISSGTPNKSYDVDRLAISKRTGWKSVFHLGQTQSEFKIQINPPSKFQHKLLYLSSLPSTCIINRKAIHYAWTFRQYFAQCAMDSGVINTTYHNNYKIIAFLYSINIHDIYRQIIPFWKLKIQPKVNQNINESKRILSILLQQLWIVLNSKQFECIPQFLSKSTLNNNTLHNMRNSIIGDIMQNILIWINTDFMINQYQRSRNYTLNYHPIQINKRQFSNYHLHYHIVNMLLNK